LEIDLARMLLTLSHSLDFSFKGAMQHHQHVALMSLKLGRAAGMSGAGLWDLFKAAIIHDIGAVTWREKASLEPFEVEEPWDHCRRGATFVSEVGLLGPSSDIILSHHDRYAGGNRSGLAGGAIPLSSRIIHLVDRIDVSIVKDEPILDQRRSILERIEAGSGEVFDPELVGLLGRLAKNESFWLELATPWVTRIILTEFDTVRIAITADDLAGLAEVFAKVIDAKSPFTHRHSRGVAAVARNVAERLGLSSVEIELLTVAALLHDVGKLSLPESILEKTGPLDASEMNTVKQHTFFTYYWIKPAFPQLNIAEWAAYHHERLDGTGYPFGIGADRLDLKSRIIAVSDVFTALREERPYRTSMGWDQIERIIRDMVGERALDGEVAEVVLSDRSNLDLLWGKLTEKLNRP
jgi:HD-GYP domain-containing protein (c-di-GMP phosphodiesterase class II)